MGKSTIWLSYDLGVQGDYEGLYTWLDAHQAKECGSSLAVFQYEYSSNIADEIKKDIERSVNIEKKDRIYIIYKRRDGKKLNKGVFLFGNRRGAPWKGYHAESAEHIDEEEF